jgi:hypothetical protein
MIIKHRQHIVASAQNYEEIQDNDDECNNNDEDYCEIVVLMMLAMITMRMP